MVVMNDRQRISHLIEQGGTTSNYRQEGEKGMMMKAFELAVGKTVPSDYVMSEEEQQAELLEQTRMVERAVNLAESEEDARNEYKRASGNAIGQINHTNDRHTPQQVRCN